MYDALINLSGVTGAASYFVLPFDLGATPIV